MRGVVADGAAPRHRPARHAARSGRRRCRPARTGHDGGSRRGRSRRGRHARLLAGLHPGGLRRHPRAGERRSPSDHAIAGAASGPGAVQAGVITLLTSPDLPLNPLLPGIAALLDARATAYAISRLILLPLDRPPFVGLSFDHRTTLVTGLFRADDLDRPIWQLLAFLVGLAFDTAAHRHTAQALAEGHPGLVWTGFPQPDADGLWRYPSHSYGTALAEPHPATTPSGSPA